MASHMRKGAMASQQVTCGMNEQPCLKTIATNSHSHAHTLCKCSVLYNGRLRPSPVMQASMWAYFQLAVSSTVLD